MNAEDVYFIDGVDATANIADGRVSMAAQVSHVLYVKHFEQRPLSVHEPHLTLRVADDDVTVTLDLDGEAFDVLADAIASGRCTAMTDDGLDRVPPGRAVDVSVTMADALYDRIALEAGDPTRAGEWIREAIHRRLLDIDRDLWEHVDVEVDVPAGLIERAELRAESARLAGRTDVRIEDYLHDYLHFEHTYHSVDRPASGDDVRGDDA